RSASRTPRFIAASMRPGVAKISAISTLPADSLLVLLTPRPPEHLVPDGLVMHNRNLSAAPLRDKPNTCLAGIVVHAPIVCQRLIDAKEVLHALGVLTANDLFRHFLVSCLRPLDDASHTDFDVRHPDVDQLHVIGP